MRPRAAVLPLLAFAGCVYPATEVRVEIDSDAPAERALTVVATVRAGTATAGPGGAHTWARGGAGTDSLPLAFLVVPSADEPHDDAVTLVVEAQVAARGTDPARTFRRVARFAFTPRTPTRVPIFLAIACANAAADCTTPGAPCTVAQRCEEQGLTCGDDGTCVPIAVTPTPLADAGSRRDAAAVDAALPADVVDARGGTDAGDATPAADVVDAGDARTTIDAGDAASGYAFGTSTTTTPLRGVTGGASSGQLCRPQGDAGSAVTTLGITSDAWVHAVGYTCSDIVADGSVTSAHSNHTFGNTTVGTLASEPCAAGGVLVGITGSAITSGDAGVVALGAICAPFAQWVAAGTGAATLAVHGGVGGTPFADRCPPGSVGQGLGLHLNGSVVTGIQLDCVPISRHRERFRAGFVRRKLRRPPLRLTRRTGASPRPGNAVHVAVVAVAGRQELCWGPRPMDLQTARAQARAATRDALFANVTRHLDPAWIEEALAASGVATLRRRRLPAEPVLWLVIGRGLFRGRSIAALVGGLDLAQRLHPRPALREVEVAAREQPEPVGGQLLRAEQLLRGVGGAVVAERHAIQRVPVARVGDRVAELVTEDAERAGVPRPRRGAGPRGRMRPRAGARRSRLRLAAHHVDARLARRARGRAAACPRARRCEALGRRRAARAR